MCRPFLLAILGLVVAAVAISDERQFIHYRCDPTIDALTKDKCQHDEKKRSSDAVTLWFALACSVYERPAVTPASSSAPPALVLINLIAAIIYPFC
ncbi:unnamed protein product, partial [Mesorhabditis spiculigera]